MMLPVTKVPIVLRRLRQSPCDQAVEAAEVAAEAEVAAAGNLILLLERPLKTLRNSSNSNRQYRYRIAYSVSVITTRSLSVIQQQLNMKPNA